MKAPEADKALAAFTRGEGHMRAREFYKAAEAFNEAVEMADAPTFRLRFSQCALEMGKTHDAIHSARRALELSETLDHAALYIASCQQLSRALMEEADFPKAVVFAQEALEVALKLGEAETTASALNLLGLCHSRGGAHKRGLENYLKALALESAGLAGKTLADTLGNIGSARYFLGELDEALASHQRALAIYEETGDGPSLGMCHYNLGLALERLGKTDDARAHYGKSADIFESEGMEKHLKAARASLEEL